MVHPLLHGSVIRRDCFIVPFLARHSDRLAGRTTSFSDLRAVASAILGHVLCRWCRALAALLACSPSPSACDCAGATRSALAAAIEVLTTLSCWRQLSWKESAYLGISYFRGYLWEHLGWVVALLLVLGILYYWERRVHSAPRARVSQFLIDIIRRLNKLAPSVRLFEGR